MGVNQASDREWGSEHSCVASKFRSQEDVETGAFFFTARLESFFGVVSFCEKC